MDKKRRRTAHEAYDREARKHNPAQIAKRRRPKTESITPRKTEAERARTRATDAAFEGMGLNASAAGTAGAGKIDELLRTPDRAAVETRRKYGSVDLPFLMLVIGLLCFGMVMMYSASYAWSINDFGTPNHYVNRQLLCAGIGLTAMVAIAVFDYTWLRKAWMVFAFYFIVFALLLTVLIMGQTSGGAKRWINLGAFTFQPSEFAKLAVIWALAWFYTHPKFQFTRVPRPPKCDFFRKHKLTWRLYQSFLGYLKSVGPFLLILLPVVLMLVEQNHLSAIVIVVATGGMILFFAGAKVHHLAITVGAGGAGIAALALFSENLAHVMPRIQIWQDPFSDPRGLGYQTIQSLYAIASGGLFGLGLGNSRQKQLYLSQSHNDYVFAIVCEELGFVGAAFLILLFLALIIRGYWIAIHARDKFGTLLAAGITTMLMLQILMNIAVVTNTMPVTGVSLPFFSAGGTSLILLLAEMGIILSVSRQIRREKVAVKQKPSAQTAQ